MRNSPVHNRNGSSVRRSICKIRYAKLSFVLFLRSDHSTDPVVISVLHMLARSILTDKDAAVQAERLAPWLSSLSTASDWATALEQSNAVAAQLLTQATAIRKGTSKEIPQATHDPVVEEVQSAPDLDEYEERLLGAIVDPSECAALCAYEAERMMQQRSERRTRTFASSRTSSKRSARSYHSRFCTQKRTAPGFSARSPWLAFCYTALPYAPGLPFIGFLMYTDAWRQGTGKTMLCRALAKESGARMLQIQASNVTSMWHSESEKLIHAAFVSLALARRLLS